MAFDVSPDLSSFAKIVAGGLPGACVAGRKDILDLLDFNVAARTGREKIAHPGTFNANPVSAAAGTAALTVIAETDAADRAAATAADLREKLNAVLADAHVPWAVYGTYSGFHLFVNPSGLDVGPYSFDPAKIPLEDMKKSAEITGEQAAAGDAGERRRSRSAGAAGCCHARTRRTTSRTRSGAAAVACPCEAGRELPTDGDAPSLPPSRLLQCAGGPFLAFFAVWHG